MIINCTESLQSILNIASKLSLMRMKLQNLIDLKKYLINKSVLKNIPGHMC